MPETETGVILLLGNYRPSLTLARSLNKRGYRIIVGTLGCDRGCQHSNAVSALWEHSPLNKGLDLFVQELQSFAAKTPDLKAIFPVAEEYVRAFAEHPEISSKLPSIVTMEPALVNLCLDKPELLKLATDNGVGTAPFDISRNQQELQKVGSEIGFPLIIRPTDSTKRLNAQKALIVESPDDLTKQISALNLGAQTLLIQKIFNGARHNIYFAAVDGKMTRRLHAVIERTDSPDDTGLAVRGRTVSANSVLVEETSRLVNALGYTGIGCAQFLVNEQTGATSFLEINPRIAGNHALPEFAGLKLADFMLQYVIEKKSDMTQITGKAGIRFGWVSGDLMGAKLAYLRKQIGAIALLTWFCKALANAATADVHMVFSRSDPKPSLYALFELRPRFSRWRKSLPSVAEPRIRDDAVRISK